MTCVLLILISFPNKDGIQLEDEVVALWDEVRGVVR